MRRLARVVAMLTGLALTGPVAGVPAAAAHPLPDPRSCDGCYAPALETSWQWQLQGIIDTSVDVEMYDIDGFEAKKSLVSALHDDGRMVVC